MAISEALKQMLFAKTTQSDTLTAELVASLNLDSGVTAGTATASKSIVLDSTKSVIGLGRATYGAFSSTAALNGVAVNPANTGILRVYADDAGAALTPSGAVGDLRPILGRYLITVTQAAVKARVWGSMGQVKLYNTLFNDEQVGGVNGRLEVVQASATTGLAGYGISAGVVGIFATAGTTSVGANAVAAGVAAVADIKGTCTQTGIVAGFYVGTYNTSQWSDATTRAKWNFGLVIPAAATVQPIRVGDWVGSGAKGSAVAFGTAMQFYSDGQLDVIGAFGESNSDLTSAFSAKVGRFRHLVSNSTAGGTTAISVAHETYGLVGQLVAKNATLTHLHAGLMGTFEGNTAGVVANSAYTYGVAAVIGRVGGGATITATKAVCGVAAVLNGAAMASGNAVAFAACATSTADWNFGLALIDCTTGITMTAPTTAMVVTGAVTQVFDFTGASTAVLEDNKVFPDKAGSIKILMPSGGAAYINIYDGSAG
jgi:hypothetical protein